MAFVKWITCSVGESDRERFSVAQRCWSELAGEPGLIAQAGGWDAGLACILGCWTDRPAYAAFMSDRHDDIAMRSGQAGTYTSIDVATGESVLDIPGRAAGVADAALLRVADCRLREGRQEHFTRVQRDVWIPAMTVADGMLGGLFSRLGEDRYLVTTWWSSVQAHQRYATTDVPELRRRAAVDEDIAQLRGHALVLEPEWSVLYTPGKRRSIDA
jgi:heme-degrading monooxygenase HmoA